MEKRQLILNRPMAFREWAFRGSIWGEGCRARVSSDRLAAWCFGNLNHEPSGAELRLGSASVVTILHLGEGLSFCRTAQDLRETVELS